MQRREALQKVAVLLGGTIIGGNLFLQTGCKPADKNVNKLFKQSDIDLLNEVADTILPTTASSPGAKAAKVGDFMAVMVLDCYDEKNQKIFTEGIQKLDAECKKQIGKSFMDADVQQRTSFLTALDKEQSAYSKNKKKEEDAHYFRQMKELTLLGYFSSEIGCTQALRYVESPGKYEGCVPYKKGDKAWAV